MNYSKFHINFLAKQTAMNRMAKICNLIPQTTPVLVMGDRIERSKPIRRDVISGLLADGYIFRSPGQLSFEVTDKAFDEVPAGEWDGDVIVGSPKDPLAFKVPVRCLKGMLQDYQQGLAEPTTTPNGLVFFSKVGGDQTIEPDQWVLENLPALVCELLDLSPAQAQLVSTRGSSDALDLDHLGEHVEVFLAEGQKEINRIKMRMEAFELMTMRVNRSGGWEKFIDQCRSVQQREVGGK